MAAAANKWHAYYDRGLLQWDSGRVSSQLAAYMSTCAAPIQPFLASSPQSSADIAAAANQGSIVTFPQLSPSQTLHICGKCAAVKPAAGASILEIGCGTGASCIWLAQQGFSVTGIDIVPDAIRKARAAAAAAAEEAAVAAEAEAAAAAAAAQQHLGAAGKGAPAAEAAAVGSSQPTFLVHDVMQLSDLGQQFDMIYDCQVDHALIKDIPGALQSLPQLLFEQLKPGGVLFMLTGNANEPEVGPSVLTAKELLGPLMAAGFSVVQLQQTRFDGTDYYDDVLGKRPLAWCAVLQRLPPLG